MKLNIQKFATSDAWTLQTYLKDYKYNSKGELTQITVKIESNYNIGSIYDIDSEDNENWAYSAWNIHTGVGEYPYTEVPYIERTFKNLNNLKGVKLTCYEGDSTENKYVYYNFTMTTDEDASTTYLTKTSATAVLKGNVLNSLNTYDYNNAPSVGAVRNYLESSAVLHQSDIENIVSQAVSAALLAGHPVGSIEVNVSGDNPGTYLGGTWESFGTGKTLVGIDASQTEFNTIEKTGGEKTHTLTSSELPKLSGEGQFKPYDNFSTSGIVQGKNWSQTKNFSAASGIQKTSTVYGFQINFGGDQPHNNLQPYITVYFWKRIN